MNIIEKGLDNRSFEMIEIVSGQEEVIASEGAFWDCYEEVLKVYGHSELLSKLEDVVVGMEHYKVHAAYRLGVSDGMVLQQEINGIRKEGRA